jgi:hypothetical protein
LNFLVGGWGGGGGGGPVMISFLKQTTRVASRKSLFKDVFALVIHKANLTS